jgi:hypothetical protein
LDACVEPLHALANRSAAAAFAAATPGTDASGATPTGAGGREVRSTALTRASGVHRDFGSRSLSGEARGAVQPHGDDLATQWQPIHPEGNADGRGSRDDHLALIRGGGRRAGCVRGAVPRKRASPCDSGR